MKLIINGIELKELKEDYENIEFNFYKIFIADNLTIKNTLFVFEGDKLKAICKLSKDCRLFKIFEKNKLINIENFEVINEQI